MGRKLVSNVDAVWLSEQLGLPFSGVNTDISSVENAATAGPGAFTFAKTERWGGLLGEKCLAVVSKEVCDSVICNAIISESPRFDFIRALGILEKKIGFVWSINQPSIHPSAIVGENCVIGKGVTIGADSVIGHNVVIGDEVIIGERVIVKSGAVIGESGFGFERNADGSALRFPHIGGVVIGDDVEIGSLTTVCRGTIDDTIIKKGVKIDDHVHIAHNCHIDEHAFVIACAEVSGGVKIGQRAWIAPNSSIINQLSIGDDAVVGIGAVVVKPVADGSIVAGNPARALIRKK